MTQDFSFEVFFLLFFSYAVFSLKMLSYVIKKLFEVIKSIKVEKFFNDEHMVIKSKRPSVYYLNKFKDNYMDTYRFSLEPTQMTNLLLVEVYIAIRIVNFHTSLTSHARPRRGASMNNLWWSVNSNGASIFTDICYIFLINKD